MVTNNSNNEPTAASGKVLQGQGIGTASNFSTATYPSIATGTGTILRADGTNWVATTATYPATTTSQQILYSTAANVVGQLTTANSALAATNSSGTLAMRLFSVVNQIFTATGTYTPTSGMLYCIIQCIGGGGGGGGTATSGVGQVSSGSGGGAGEYAQGVFSAATIGASKAVTIGAAGTANSGAAGGNGGNTSVGATNISANGGTGGLLGVTSSSPATSGGAGGTGGTGGDFRSAGRPGSSGWGNFTITQICPGDGGSSQFGSGGLGARGGTNTVGNPGLGYGSGGGGSLLYQSQSANAGAAGTAGIVIITEYVIA